MVFIPGFDFDFFSTSQEIGVSDMIYLVSSGTLTLTD